MMLGGLYVEMLTGPELLHRLLPGLLVKLLERLLVGLCTEIPTSVKLLCELLHKLRVKVLTAVESLSGLLTGLLVKRLVKLLNEVLDGLFPVGLLLVPPPTDLCFLLFNGPGIRGNWGVEIKRLTGVHANKTMVVAELLPGWLCAK